MQTLSTGVQKLLLLLLCAQFTLVACKDGTVKFAKNKLAQPFAFEHGPYLGGRLTGIVPDDVDPNKLAICSPGGGVWVTTNNGKKWTAITDGLNDPTIYHLEWDLMQRNRLYAISPSALFACDNPFGTNPSWQTLAGGAEKRGQVHQKPAKASWSHQRPYGFAQMEFTGGKHAVIWSRWCDSLFYSFDGGKSFTAGNITTTDPSKLQSFITCMATDGSNRLYLGTLEYGELYRTKAWAHGKPSLATELVSQRTAGLGIYVELIDLVWLPKSKQLAALGIDLYASPQLPKMFLFNDATKSWKALSNKDAGFLFATDLTHLGNDVVAMSNFATRISADLGDTWVQSMPKGDHADTRAITMRHYTALNKTYVWKVTDGFKFSVTEPSGWSGNIARWESSANGSVSNYVYIPTVGVEAWQAHNVAAVPVGKDKLRMFSGSIDNGSMCLDPGQSWTRDGAPNVLGTGDIWSIVAAPSNPNRLYVRGWGYRFAVTDNAQSAKTTKDVRWTTMNAGANKLELQPPRYLTNGMTAVDPTDADKVYFVTDRAIARSTDAGKTFAFSKLPNETEGICICAPGAGLYVGTYQHGIYESIDDGKTWKAFGLNTNSPMGITNVIKTPYQGGTYFAASTNGLYRKRPNEAWKLITDSGHVVMDVVSNPLCPQAIWATRGYSPWNLQEGEIIVSVSNGDKWTTHYYQGTPIADLEVVTFEGESNQKRVTLLVASYGRGIQSIPLAAGCK